MKYGVYDLVQMKQTSLFAVSALQSSASACHLPGVALVDEKPNSVAHTTPEGNRN